MVFLSIPVILRVANMKNLFDEPNRRTVHRIRIPTLGGLAIFVGFLFTYSLFVDILSYSLIPFLIPALVVIFGIGIKDDILATAPMVKLSGQIVASVIVVIIGGTMITDFHGFFGLQPNYITSISLSILLMVFIINGFNLIDGVDGLAATIGIITTTAFSTWFFINGNYHIPILGAALVGALIAFLYYNVFSKNKKIFMGDTGSLLIGFLISVVAILFCEFSNTANQPNLKFTMNSAPAVAVAILIVPVIDTIRIFFLRISIGKSPFAADKNHIHHRLLALGYNHLQVSLIIGIVNVLFVIIGFALRNIGMLKLLSLIMGLGMIVAYIPSLLLAIKRHESFVRFKRIKKAQNQTSH